MKKQKQLKVQKRKSLGSAAVGRLRRSGIIPGVIYGKSGTESIQVNEPELRYFMRSIAGSAALVEVSDDAGLRHLSVIEAIQRDPITDKFLHVDFHEIAPDELMTVTVPIHLKGESEGVKSSNGVLEFLAHRVDIKCLPKDLPDYVVVDISELKIGDAVHLKSLPVLEGVAYLGDPEQVIVAVSEPKLTLPEAASVGAEAVPAEGAEGAAPAEGGGAAEKAEKGKEVKKEVKKEGKEAKK